MANKNLFKYFKTSPEIIRSAVMFYVRYPLSYRQVEDILHERGIDICHETVRFWVERFGSKFAPEIRKKSAGHHSNWQWHLDEAQKLMADFARKNAGKDRSFNTQ